MLLRIGYTTNKLQLKGSERRMEEAAIIYHFYQFYYSALTALPNKTVPKRRSSLQYLPFGTWDFLWAEKYCYCPLYIIIRMGKLHPWHCCCCCCFYQTMQFSQTEKGWLWNKSIDNNSITLKVNINHTTYFGWVVSVKKGTYLAIFYDETNNVQ